MVYVLRNVDFSEEDLVNILNESGYSSDAVLGMISDYNKFSRLDIINCEESLINYKKIKR